MLKIQVPSESAKRDLSVAQSNAWETGIDPTSLVLQCGQGSLSNCRGKSLSRLSQRRHGDQISSETPPMPYHHASNICFLHAPLRLFCALARGSNKEGTPTAQLSAVPFNTLGTLQQHRRDDKDGGPRRLSRQ